MSWSAFSLHDTEQALAELGSVRQGLSAEEAAKRLLEHRSDRIDEEEHLLPRLIMRQLRSSFVYLLLAAAALSFFLNDRFEALLIMLFIGVNVGLQTYQEYRSEQAVKTLKRYLALRSRVRRAGEVITIESESVVPGDIVILSAGDRLPADVRFLETNGLEINESVMTGESVAVRKQAPVPETPPTEMHEASDIGFAGTVVTAGCGEGVVFAIGKETTLGDISKLVEESAPETSFERGIREFSRFIMRLVFFTVALIFIANLVIKRGDIDAAELLIFSLALAVSVVPEALPAVLTVALSRGSMRLAQKKVVVKRLSSIEDLGGIEILCTDKTGTITENSLSISLIKAADERRCLKLAFAACLEEPVHRGRLHDAFDLALWNALQESERGEVFSWKRLGSIPFDPDRRRNSVHLSSGTGEEIIVRGAPEEVIHVSKNLDSYAAREAMAFVAEAGRNGARVLAVARKTFASGRPYTVYEEQELEFIGLIAFADQLKKTAKQTIEAARALHVGVKILTGDSREVAGSVGYAIGLISDPDDVVTGKELKEMEEPARRQAIFDRAVFARISPEQKYDIIRTLQDRHVVGFLGEGINDAPALKRANVGIVVESASDVAREAADVILLQKNLGTVIEGIREGRIIFTNILKYLRITMTSNFGNFYSVAVASLFLPFVPLLPMQILLVDLLSDFPMLAIATDRVESEELENPRQYNVRDVILVGTLLGAVSSVFDFIVFGSYYKTSPETLQTAWFFLSAFTEVVLIFSLRSFRGFWKSSRPSWLLGGLSVLVLSIVIALPFIPAAREAFMFVHPPKMMLPFMITIAVVYFFSTEAMKRLYGKHMREHLSLQHHPDSAAVR